MLLCSLLGVLVAYWVEFSWFGSFYWLAIRFSSMLFDFYGSTCTTYNRALFFARFIFFLLLLGFLDDTMYFTSALFLGQYQSAVLCCLELIDH